MMKKDPNSNGWDQITKKRRKREGENEREELN